MSKQHNEALNAEIRRVLQEKGLSVKDLAGLAELPWSTVYKRMDGSIGWPFQDVIAVEHALKLPKHHLVRIWSPALFQTQADKDRRLDQVMATALPYTRADFEAKIGQSVTSKEIGDLVHSHLQIQDMSVRDLAEKIGIHWNNVYKRMRGDLTWKVDDLEKVAKVLKVDPSAYYAVAIKQRLLDPTPLPPGFSQPAPANRENRFGGIPVYNYAAAGRTGAWVADDSVEEPIKVVDRNGISDPAAFGVLVSGDSMEPTLYEGDTVICSPIMEGQEARLRDRMIVFVRTSEDRGGDALLARLYFADETRRRIRLIKDNPKYAPINLSLSHDHISRIAEVVESRRNLRTAR